ncbi:chymotrypsinogen B-like [Hyalella azteca]|uniref:Chymotrypsinogen B-like n=1 Tax=Hyalella azteca TaxID=294128 RepID=A0A8B7PRE5_HYAAZ|nr:chymotrypsinogen B-like [Hyalella azteca]
MSQFFQGFYAREKAMPATRCADQEENISFVPRIVDGVYANIHEYPWQVALFYITPGKNKSKSAFFCGASLISDSFVLTAAHCVLGSSKRADRIRAILGDHDLSTRKETDSTYRDIRRIIFNVHYRADTVRNDIALLQLEKPVMFSSSINPVLLPWALDDTFEGLNATVTGWGRDKIGKRISSYVLKEYSSSLLTEATCDRQWSTKSTLKPQLSTDPKKQICLDVSKGSPCHGDSGGPLVVCSGEVCTQVGVVSFGFPLCKNVGLPAVFTRLTYYRPWLDINMASANAMPV